MDDNQKQQEHLNNFKVYIQGLEEIKKDLEELKKKNISDSEKLYQETDSLHAKHSNKFQLASGHYGAGKLNEISGCSDSLNEYKKLVDELYNLKHETLKKLKSTQCAYCQKKNLTSPYVYENDHGYQTVFCNADCLTKWKEKLSQYTCEWCKQNKSGQYWYLKGAKNQKKFCSETCLNYWKENQQSTKEPSSKICVDSNCSNKLTKDDISYCQDCIRKNDEALKNLEKGQKEWRKEVARKVIQDCFLAIGSLAERLFKENTAGTHEDYREIKKVQKKINELEKERKWNSPLIEADIKSLKKSCQDLINEYISPKDRQMVDSKHYINRTCCVGSAIKLDEKDQEYYCDYCWERESPKFLNSLRNNLLDDFNKIYLEEKHFSFDFNNNSSYKKLRNNSFINQGEIKQAFQELLEELVDNHKNSNITQKDKDNNLNMNTAERERESNLEPKNNHLIYWAIGIIGVSLITLLGFLIIRKNK